jgi:hypothetical protein
MVTRLLTPQNIGMSAGLWLVLEMLRRLLPGLFQGGAFNRLLPILPETVGAAAYWLIPSLAAPNATLGERLLIGIVVGTGSSKVHKLISQSLLGKDSDIRAAKAAKAKKPTEGEAAKVDDETTKPDVVPKPNDGGKAA